MQIKQFGPISFCESKFEGEG